MRISTLPQFKRNARRFREILTILGRYGLAEWVRRNDPEFIKGLFRNADGQKLSDLPQEVRIRMALTELGTTFIKLGQMLSTREDIVGPAIAAELTKLQEGTPPDPPETVRATIEAELGSPPEELFEEFEEQPMASASIGQVHGARLSGGEAVVVKVQHDRIEERIVNDLDILITLAEVAERTSEEARLYQPKSLAVLFRRNLFKELDFSSEKRNLSQFSQNFAGDETVHFPLPYPELSGRRVLTMERLEGLSVADDEALQGGRIDRKEIARRGVNVYLEMIFRDGFYHADPHPGNIYVLPGNVVGLLDCGMVGRVDDETRDNFEGLLRALLERDSVKFADYVLRLSSTPVNLDRDALQGDLDEFLAEYLNQPLKELDLAAALNMMIEIVRNHRIVLAPGISLLLKVLVMLDGTGRLLDPDFNLAEVLQPYYLKLVKRKYSPEKVLRRFRRSYHDWERLIDTLPLDLGEIRQQIRSGRFSIFLEHRRLDTAINRLVYGLLTAALFLASAQLWSLSVPPLIKGVPVVGAVGFAIAFGLAFNLLRTIHRSGGLDSKD